MSEFLRSMGATDADLANWRATGTTRTQAPTGNTLGQNLGNFGTGAVHGFGNSLYGLATLPVSATNWMGLTDQEWADKPLLGPGGHFGDSGNPADYNGWYGAGSFGGFLGSLFTGGAAAKALKSAPKAAAAVRGALFPEKLAAHALVATRFGKAPPLVQKALAGATEFGLVTAARTPSPMGDRLAHGAHSVPMGAAFGVLGRARGLRRPDGSLMSPAKTEAFMKRMSKEAPAGTNPITYAMERGHLHPTAPYEPLGPAFMQRGKDGFQHGIGYVAPTAARGAIAGGIAGLMGPMSPFEMTGNQVVDSALFNAGLFASMGALNRMPQVNATKNLREAKMRANRKAAAKLFATEDLPDTAPFSAMDPRTMGYGSFEPGAAVTQHLAGGVTNMYRPGRPHPPQGPYTEQGFPARQEPRQPLFDEQGRFTRYADEQPVLGTQDPLPFLPGKPVDTATTPYHTTDPRVIGYSQARNAYRDLGAKVVPVSTVEKSAPKPDATPSDQAPPAVRSATSAVETGRPPRQPSPIDSPDAFVEVDGYAVLKFEPGDTVATPYGHHTRIVSILEDGTHLTEDGAHYRGNQLQHKVPELRDSARDQIRRAVAADVLSTADPLTLTASPAARAAMKRGAVRLDGRPYNIDEKIEAANSFPFMADDIFPGMDIPAQELMRKVHHGKPEDSTLHRLITNVVQDDLVMLNRRLFDPERPLRVVLDGKREVTSTAAYLIDDNVLILGENYFKLDQASRLETVLHEMGHHDLFNNQITKLPARFVVGAFEGAGWAAVRPLTDSAMRTAKLSEGGFAAYDAYVTETEGVRTVESLQGMVDYHFPLDNMEALGIYRAGEAPGLPYKVRGPGSHKPLVPELLPEQTPVMHEVMPNDWIGPSQLVAALRNRVTGDVSVIPMYERDGNTLLSNRGGVADKHPLRDYTFLQFDAQVLELMHKTEGLKDRLGSTTIAGRDYGWTDPGEFLTELQLDYWLSKSPIDFELKHPGARELLRIVQGGPKDAIGFGPNHWTNQQLRQRGLFSESHLEETFYGPPVGVQFGGSFSKDQPPAGAQQARHRRVWDPSKQNWRKNKEGNWVKADKPAPKLTAKQRSRQGRDTPATPQVTPYTDIKTEFLFEPESGPIALERNTKTRWTEIRKTLSLLTGTENAKSGREAHTIKTATLKAYLGGPIRAQNAAGRRVITEQAAEFASQVRMEALDIFMAERFEAFPNRKTLDRAWTRAQRIAAKKLMANVREGAMEIPYDEVGLESNDPVAFAPPPDAPAKPGRKRVIQGGITTFGRRAARQEAVQTAIDIALSEGNVSLERHVKSERSRQIIRMLFGGDIDPETNLRKYTTPIEGSKTGAMVYERSMSAVEVARELGISKSTVYSRLNAVVDSLTIDKPMPSGQLIDPTGAKHRPTDIHPTDIIPVTRERRRLTKAYRPTAKPGSTLSADRLKWFPDQVPKGTKARTLPLEYEVYNEMRTSDGKPLYYDAKGNLTRTKTKQPAITLTAREHYRPTGDPKAPVVKTTTDYIDRRGIVYKTDTHGGAKAYVDKVLAHEQAQGPEKIEDQHVPPPEPFPAETAGQKLASDIADGLIAAEPAPFEFGKDPIKVPQPTPPTKQYRRKKGDLEPPSIVEQRAEEYEYHTRFPGQDGITDPTFGLLSLIRKMEHTFLRFSASTTQQHLNNQILKFAGYDAKTKQFTNKFFGENFPILREMAEATLPVRKKGPEARRAQDEVIARHLEALALERVMDINVEPGKKPRFGIIEQDTGRAWTADNPGTVALLMDQRTRRLVHAPELAGPEFDFIQMRLPGNGPRPPRGADRAVDAEWGGAPPTGEAHRRHHVTNVIGTKYRHVSDVMADVSESLGDPRPFDYHVELQEKYSNAHTHSSEWDLKAAKVMRKNNVKTKRMVPMREAAEAIGIKAAMIDADQGFAAAKHWVETNLDRLYTEAGLAPNEIKAIREMRPLWNRLYNIFEIEEPFLPEYFPLAFAPRPVSESAPQYTKVNRVLKRAKFPAAFERSGELAPTRHDGYVDVFRSYARSGFRWKLLFEKEAPGNIFERIDSLADEYTQPDGNPARDLAPLLMSRARAASVPDVRIRAAQDATRKHIRMTKKQVDKFERTVRELESLPFRSQLADTLHKASDYLGVKLDRQDILTPLDMFILAHRGRTFGFHGMRSTRHFTYSWFTTLPRVGIKAYTKAWKAMVNPGTFEKMYAMAAREGAIPPAFIEDYATNRSLLPRMVDRMTFMYKFGDTWERVLSFTSQRIRSLEAYEGYKSHKDIERFSRESGLNRLHPAWRRNIKTMVLNGQGKQAANRHAKAITNHSIHDYSRTNAPEWSGSVWARFFGQYGRWAIAAVENFRGMVMWGSRAERMGMATQYAASAAAVYGLGQFFGVRTSDWIPFIHSTTYSLGPGWSVGGAFTDIIGGDPQAEAGLLKNLRTDPVATLVSFPIRYGFPAGDPLSAVAAEFNFDRRQRRLFGIPRKAKDTRQMLLRVAGFRLSDEPHHSKLVHRIVEPLFEKPAHAIQLGAKAARKTVGWE